jgi:HEAT repeat protein
MRGNSAWTWLRITILLIGLTAAAVAQTAMPGGAPPTMPPAQMPSVNLPQPPALPPSMGRGIVSEPRMGIGWNDAGGDPLAPSLNGPDADRRLDGRLMKVTRDSQWLQWWEANRERYWPEPADTEAARDAAKKLINPRKLPDNVAAALEKAARSRQAPVRAQAALALGLVQHPRAATLLQTLINDSDDTTAINAWAALGLLESGDASRFLSRSATRPRDMIGRALCIGLQPEPDAAVWDSLVLQVKQSTVPEARRLALWAMRIHRAPPTQALAMQIVHTTTDRDLFAEAVLALGDMNQPEGQRIITDIIRMAESARALPAIANDPDFRLVWTADAPNATPRRPGSRDNRARTRVTGLAHDYRTIAILAAIESGAPSAETADAIRSAVGGRAVGLAVAPDERPIPVNQPSMPPEEPARMIGMGLVGRADDGIILNDSFRIDFNKYLAGSPVAGLSAQSSRVMDLQRFMQFPSRPMAALGLGLALRRNGDGLLGAGGVSAETGAALPDASGNLANQLQLATEALDVRCACALALGLAQTPANKDRLKGILRNNQPGEEVVLGYTLLALGLLGDAETVDLAADALGPGSTQFTADMLLDNERRRGLSLMPMDELLTRRAIVDGLAALGDPRALPVLLDQWGRDDALTLDTARAIARCLRPAVMNASPKELGALLDNYTGALIELVGSDSNHLAALSMASLGMLYASPEMFQRLGSITAGNDYTCRSAITTGAGRIDLSRAYPLPVLRLSNPFYAITLR